MPGASSKGGSGVHCLSSDGHAGGRRPAPPERCAGSEVRKEDGFLLRSVGVSSCHSLQGSASLKASALSGEESLGQMRARVWGAFPAHHTSPVGGTWYLPWWGRRVGTTCCCCWKTRRWRQLCKVQGLAPSRWVLCGIRRVGTS